MPLSTNLRDPGVIRYAHSAAVKIGDIIKIGSVIGVAKGVGAANETVEYATCWQGTAPKATGGSTALTIGAIVYWDDTAKVVTATSSGNTKCGFVVAAAADGDATVEVEFQVAA